jgi:metal-sulfur cluster biosynthetic enzyme
MAASALMVVAVEEGVTELGMVEDAQVEVEVRVEVTMATAPGTATTTTTTTARTSTVLASTLISGFIHQTMA